MIRFGHGWLIAFTSILSACAVDSLEASSEREGEANDSRATDVAPVESPELAVQGDTRPPEAAPVRVRMVAANISSGNDQSYDPGEGIRIFQGLKPDVVLLQEFNYAEGQDSDLRTFVDVAFGPDFSFAREPDGQIPNGVVSRYPIRESGSWDDSRVANRAFTWARIDVPGPKDLWAVSLHLLTTNASLRHGEATQLVGYLRAHVPAGDFVVVGGDFNTGSRSESCVADLSAIVTTGAPYPVDANGNGNTNAARRKPYDWLLASPALDALETPVVIGTAQFANGLVFDSRVFSPLSIVEPVRLRDSAARNMQHMPVVRDFYVTP